MSNITYTIRKNEHGEYVVRFHENGEFKPEWTYYTDDKQDARETAQAVIRQSIRCQ